MQDLSVGELSIQVLDAKDKLVLHWRGACRDRNPGAVLEPFFDAALAEASARARVVELRFEKLAYFNSSTIGALLRFIDGAVKRAVRVQLFYDASQRWQGHNFEAIAAFNRASGLVEVHGVGPRHGPISVA